MDNYTSLFYLSWVINITLFNTCLLCGALDACAWFQFANVLNLYYPTVFIWMKKMLLYLCWFVEHSLIKHYTTSGTIKSMQDVVILYYLKNKALWEITS